MLNKKYKKIHVGTFPIVLLFLTFAFLIIMNCIVATVFSVKTLIISISISFIVLMFYGFLTNGLAANIYIKSDFLERKGFFFGLYYKLKIKDIKDIKIIKIGREFYFDIVDGTHDSYSFLTSKASIKIPHTDKGKQFIKLFWEKDLTNV